MLDRRARRSSLLVVSLISLVAANGCENEANKAPASAKADAKATPQPVPVDDAKEPSKPEMKAPTKDVDTPTPADDAANKPADAPGAEAGNEDAGAADTAPAAPGGEPANDANAAGDAAADGAGEGEAAEGAADDDAGSAGKDSATLIKEARTTRTTDERALEALAEAEAAGATAKELARAAKARGDYLRKDPERAKVFYEWSAQKDETYADPMFALAKQKAVTGDVQEVVKLLKQVAERKGGKTLLQQIDFDQTWDIIKDDPEVRALL